MTAHLRVLTPDKVLDPGTTYIVDEGVTVPTRADADCFGPPGGSGAEYTYEKPNALSLLATAGRTTEGRLAALAHRPVRVRARDLRRSAARRRGRASRSGTSRPTTRSRRSAPTSSRSSDGDEILFYLAPDDFPNPNPAELELESPAGAVAGRAVRGHGRRAQVRDRPEHVRDHLHQRPGRRGDRHRRRQRRRRPAPTARRRSRSTDVGEATLTATRGTDIPSEALDTCVGPERDSCPDDARDQPRRQPAGRRDQGHRGRRRDPLARRRRQRRPARGRRRLGQLRQGQGRRPPEAQVRQRRDRHQGQLREGQADDDVAAAARWPRRRSRSPPRPPAAASGRASRARARRR